MKASTDPLKLKIYEPAEGSHESKLKVVVAPDSHVCILAEGVDLVLLGADRIVERGVVRTEQGKWVV